MKQLKQSVFTTHLLKVTLTVLLLGGFMSAQQPLFAAEMPCVKEVCIGDDLNKLQSIKFKQVDPARAQSVSKRKQIDRAEMYGSTQSAELPAYLVLGEFDENALDDMTKIKAACHPFNSLEGVYVSDSGYRTSVQVGLWPDKSGNMKWLVKGISRAYKGMESRSESNQLIQDLQEKYAKWDVSKVGQPKPGQAGMMLIPVRETILTLFMAPTAEAIQVDNYKKNPLCKPLKKINLD